MSGEKITQGGELLLIDSLPAGRTFVLAETAHFGRRILDVGTTVLLERVAGSTEELSMCFQVNGEPLVVPMADLPESFRATWSTKTK